MEKLEMQDGTVVDLTMNNLLLYKLRAKDRRAYDNFYNALAEKGFDRFFGSIQIIWTAYLCAMLKKSEYESAMSYEDFLEKLPEGVDFIIGLRNRLSNPKKRGSAKLLNAPAEGENGAV